MKILHINTSDSIGGASAIALQLHQACLQNGIESRMVVGVKQTGGFNVSEMQHNIHKPFHSRILLNAAKNLEHQSWKGAYRLHKLLQFAAEPRRRLQVRKGEEDFHFPGTWRILNGNKPDLLHCHNLHGGYFDLNALPWLSESVPVLLTLHDAWMISGHCAHSLDCEKWRTGCGECPYLSLYPAIPRDQTAFNWRRKQDLYKKSLFSVSTPSRWLLSRVEKSILAPAIGEARVIPNGVDLELFHPGDQSAVRTSLGLPMDQKILLTVGNQIQSNAFKDFPTLRTAFHQLARNRPDRNLLLIALGEKGPAEFIERSEIRFVPYETDPRKIVPFYQATDLYVHAARADTFPTTVLEAMACGCPVVATNIGGIPEQVRTDESPTGLLTPLGNATALAHAIESVLLNKEMANGMRVQARARVVEQFDQRNQTTRYLDWYSELTARKKGAKN